MDTNRLRYFCTVARTAHVHRAAELLGVSPAALSKSIKQLESEVGVRLTEQSGRGIVITAAGRAFAAQAESLLVEWERLRTSARDQGAVKARVRLGSFEVFTTHFLGAVLGDELADTDLTLHELGPGALEQAIASEVVDIGVTYLPIPHPDLDFLRAGVVSMGIYGKKRVWQKCSLSEIPFVVPTTPLEGTPTKVIGLDGWPDNLIPRRIRFRVALMESALEICRMGLAACYLPDFVPELHNAKHRPEFALDAYGAAPDIPAKYRQQEVFLIKRKADPESRTLKRLAKAIRRVCH